MDCIRIRKIQYCVSLKTCSKCLKCLQHVVLKCNVVSLACSSVMSTVTNLNAYTYFRPARTCDIYRILKILLNFIFVRFLKRHQVNSKSVEDYANTSLCLQCCWTKITRTNWKWRKTKNCLQKVLLLCKFFSSIIW